MPSGPVGPCGNPAGSRVRGGNVGEHVCCDVCREEWERALKGWHNSVLFDALPGSEPVPLTDIDVTFSQQSSRGNASLLSRGRIRRSAGTLSDPDPIPTLGAPRALSHADVAPNYPVPGRLERHPEGHGSEWPRTGLTAGPAIDPRHGLRTHGRSLPQQPPEASLGPA
jgi:hypothetical protein